MAKAKVKAKARVEAVPIAKGSLAQSLAKRGIPPVPVFNEGVPKAHGSLSRHLGKRKRPEEEDGMSGGAGEMDGADGLRAVFARNFPASWVTPEALEGLPQKVENLLQRIGPIDGEAVISRTQQF